MRRTWLRYGWAAGWMILIYRSSATPDLRAVPLAQRFGFLPVVLGPELTDLLELLLRKSAHMISFGILALLVRFALAGSWPRLGRARLSLAAWGVAVLYAMTDEWHQTFVPTRAGTPTDVLIDATGAALALLLVHGVQWKRQKHSPPGR